MKALRCFETSGTKTLKTYCVIEVDLNLQQRSVRASVLSHFLTLFSFSSLYFVLNFIALFRYLNYYILLSFFLPFLLPFLSFVVYYYEIAFQIFNVILNLISSAELGFSWHNILCGGM
jgi:hypothetical protein